jgi:hypothetical protein
LTQTINKAGSVGEPNGEANYDDDPFVLPKRVTEIGAVQRAKKQGNFD